MNAREFIQKGVGHSALGLAHMALVAPLAWMLFSSVALTPAQLAALLAWWHVCSWFASREERDYEGRAKLDPHTQWWRAYLAFAQWTRSDLWWPVIVCAVPVAVVFAWTW